MTTVRDKHDQEIAEGDTVAFVYGGDHHEGQVVTAHHDSAFGHHHVTAQVLATLPAGSIELVKKAFQKPHTTTSRKGDK